MSTTYEAVANVHIPALKCSYQKGSRFVIDEQNNITVGDNVFTMNNTIKILIKHGILKALSEEEAKTPEKIAELNVIKTPERQKMRVEMAQDLSKPITSSNQMEEKRVIESVDNPDGKTVRGMDVVFNNGSPIKNSEERAKQKEISPEKAAQMEATKKARIEALEKARAAAAAKREAEKEAKNEAAGKEADGGK